MTTSNAPKPFRSALHGTCLLNGQHPEGSRYAAECPVLRRADPARAAQRAARSRKAAATRWRTAQNRDSGAP